MLKAIALDDEPLALKIIESFCNAIEQIELQKSFTKPNDTQKYIDNFPVDLIFLDIQMPSISGIDFYKNLSKEIMVIFTTAYSDYAVEGFNLSAVDYLLKPFTQGRFEQAVAKAVEYFHYQHVHENSKRPYLFIRADYSLIKVKRSDIIYMEGLNDYVKFHIEGQKTIVARMTMKMILEKLSPIDFIRVHRSYILPIAKIEYVRNKHAYIKNKGQLDAIPIGKSYEDELLKRMQ